MGSHRLTESNRLALLMHDHVTSPNGKMGFGLMRYGISNIVVVIDRAQAGENLEQLTGIPCNAPIVATLEEALKYSPDVLVPAIAPPGGELPVDWLPEIETGLKAGLSLVNGLHRPLANDPEFARFVQPGRFIWDIRQEPLGLDNGLGRARELRAQRVLFVGTDMANGKMTAALELHKLALKRGLRSAFVATGQIGIAIAGEGVPLDAVRVDFASGAIEAAVLLAGESTDIIFIEGQGSLLNPASTATLALMRGSMPTELILVHRAGQKAISRAPWAMIPPLKNVVVLNEMVSGAYGTFTAAKCCGIALNTSHQTHENARIAINDEINDTGLPVTDVVRFGGDILLDAILANKTER